MSIEKDLPASEYHKRPGINSSSLKKGLLSMKHMQHAMTTERKQTPSMRIGTLAHAAVLQPDLFNDSVVIWEGKKRAGAKYDAFAAIHGADWIVTESEQIQIQALSKAIHSDREAHRLIEAAETEVSLFWEDPMYGKAKARPDGLIEPDVMLSLKTTGQIKPARFGSTFIQQGYHIQIGWYAIGALLNKIKLKGVMLICAEQDPPYDVVLYKIEQEQIRDWMNQAQNLAKAYHVAEVTGVFQGCESAIIELKLPEWFTNATGPVKLKIHGEEMEV